MLTFCKLLQVEESCGDALVDLIVLLHDGGKIDEEPAAHVGLETLNLLIVGRFEPVHQEGTIFQ